MNKKYLGDGVYVEYEYNYGIILTVEDGIKVTNKIVLEPIVWDELYEYVKEIISETRLG